MNSLKIIFLIRALCLKIVLLNLFLLNVSAETFNVKFNDFQENAKCSNLQEKTFELLLNDNIYQVLLSSLYVTPIINSAMVCERFLESLRVLQNNQEIKLKPFHSQSGLLYYIDTAGVLEKICLDQGFCRRSILDTYKINPTLRSCYPNLKLSDLVSGSRPRLLKASPKIIKKLEIKPHPFYPLNTMLYDYLADPLLSEIHTSTMSMGNKTLAQLSENIKKENKRVTISYDPGLALASNQQVQIKRLIVANPNLKFIPVTSGHELKHFYHLKYLASPQSNSSIISSMNLASPEKTSYIDFNYVFEIPEIRDELIAISDLNNQRFCERKEEYRCLVNFYRPQSANDLDQLIQQNCSNYKAKPNFRRSGYLVNSEDHNLQDFVVNFINQAKKEVIITSYKLTDHAVAEALLNQQSEGINVNAILAYQSPVLLDKLKNHFYSGKLRPTSYPFPHMKVIIIDRKLMLFGTANFTANALSNTAEFMGITDSQEAITTAFDYIATVLQDDNLPLTKKLSGNIKEKTYLALQSSGLFQTNRNVEPIHTSKVSSSWMANYRLLNLEGKSLVNKCGLGHLLIINNENYQRCLRENARILTE